MQTESASEARVSWPSWAKFLRSRGLDNLAAWALEAAGPLTVLGAQVLYMGSPLLRPGLFSGQIESLAGLLEDHSEVMAFAAFLREETSS
jgi:hypothetical protein